MENIYIIDVLRTPVGSFLGSLASATPQYLAAVVIQALLKKYPQIQPQEIQEVIIGNILAAGYNQNIARQAAIQAGIPVEVPAYLVNMLCGSGLKTISQAYQYLQAGYGELYLAGGTESMSQAPYLVPYQARSGTKMGHLQLIDSLLSDGLTDAMNEYHMGITAENIAAKYGITREEQDIFAIESQQKAIAAQDAGLFVDEIVPVEIAHPKNPFVLKDDEYINRQTNLEKLGKLKPVFQKDGTVTAGNASGVNDGAAMALIAKESYVQKHQIQPLAKILAIGQGGVDPKIMGMGPVTAIRDLLTRTSLSLKDVDILELNEAFAAQSLGVVKQLVQEHKLDRDEFVSRVNINGGAIAIGHPLGASGARILSTLAYALKHKKKKYGIASLCIGGGMGVAMLIENVQS